MSGTSTLAKIQPFGPLDVDTEAALRRSIERFGIVVPIIVDGKGRILDGHNRSRIAKELRIECPQEVRRSVRDDDDATALAYSLNADRRHMTREARMEIVDDLRNAGYSLRAIAGVVGIDKRQVSRDLDSLAKSQVGTLSPPEAEDEPDVIVNARTGEIVTPNADGAEDESGHRKEATPSPESSAPDVNITIGIDGKKYPKSAPSKTRADVAARVAKAKKMAADGHTSGQIAKALDLSVKNMAEFRKRHGIDVPADAVIGKVQRDLDPDAVMERTVADIAASCSGLDALIDDFAELDGDYLDGWVSSLNESLRSLTTLRNRIKKELTRG